MTHKVYTGNNGYERFWDHLADKFNNSPLASDPFIRTDQGNAIVSHWVSQLYPEIVDCKVLNVPTDEIFLEFIDEEAATMFMLEWK